MAPRRRSTISPASRARAQRTPAGALVLVALVASLAETSTAEDRPDAASRTTYYGDVEPIFREKCLGCHGGERPKGRFSVESFEAILAGGRKGVSLAAGSVEESRLFRLVSRAEKPVMPPEKQGPLSAAEVEVIRRWIEDGLARGRPVPRDEPYSRPLDPPVYRRAPAITAITFSSGPKSEPAAASASSPGLESPVASSPRLYVAAYREILVYDLSSSTPPSFPSERWVGEAESLYSFAWSPDGRRLAAVGGSPARFGELQIWRAQTGELARFVRLGADCLYAVAYSSDGERIAVAGTDRALHVLDAESGETIYSSEIHSDWVFGVAFAAGGERIASAGRDRTVKVSTAADGSFLKNVATIDGPVMRLVARPASTQFLVGAESHDAILFDAKDMKEVRKLERQPGAVLALAFSPDGKRLALGGEADEVRLYEVDSGKRAAVLKGHEDWVYAVAFRSDGSQVAVAGYDGWIRLYDAASGELGLAFVAVPLGKVRRF